MKKTIFILLLISLCLNSCTGIVGEANYNIVPKFNEINEDIDSPAFMLDRRVGLISYSDSEEGKRNALSILEYIEDATNILISEQAEDTNIRLKLSNDIDSEEGYRISISRGEILIEAKTDAGIFYGIQAFKKTLPISKLVAVRYNNVIINSSPIYTQRGVKLDFTSEYMPIENIKSFIDIMAFHGMNTLYWQSLAYSQQNMDEVVDYAKNRYISIIQGERVNNYTESDSSSIMLAASTDNGKIISWEEKEAGRIAAFNFNTIQEPNSEEAQMMYEDYLPLSNVYSFELSRDRLIDSVKTLGATANFRVNADTKIERIEYEALPRMAALSEAQWVDGKDYDDFIFRLSKLVDHYNLLGYNYATNALDVYAIITPDVESEVIKIEFKPENVVSIYYTTDGSIPNLSSTLYESPIEIRRNVIINAVGFYPDGSRMDNVVSQKIKISKATAKKIRLINNPNSKYFNLGGEILVDGVSSKSTNIDNGEWLGYLEDELWLQLDLGRIMDISNLKFNTYINTSRNIFDVREVLIQTSEDGRSFKRAHHSTFPRMSDKESEFSGIKEYNIDFSNTSARYVNLRIWNSNNAYMFIDEISVD